jgi:hypothetical protein
MAPRMSYLPLLTEQVREHFSGHARHPHRGHFTGPA